MAHERVCVNHGMMVDGHTRLSDDPCEFDAWPVRLQVGCCQLKCRSCGAIVRGGPPGFGLKPEVKVDLALLHSAPSWVELPFIERHALVLGTEGSRRLYACKCSTHDVETTENLEIDHEFPNSPAGTWECSGHPVPELPLTLGSLRLEETTDWRDVVAKVLDGACPRALTVRPDEREGPSVWLGWLYNYLRGLPAAEQLSAALAERIVDPQPIVVGRVLYFFARFPRATGVERILARAEAAPHRVAIGYPIPESDRVASLWDVLVASKAVELIKRVMVMPLSSLSHEVLGDTDLVDCERQLKSRIGWDAHPSLMKSWLDEFAATRRRERADVVATALERSGGSFDPAMRRFLADHVIEIDAAAKGRWQQVMHVLSDWSLNPEAAQLLVLAGSRIFEAGLASADELRSWIQARRSYGRVNDEWVRPLEAVLDRGNSS